MELSILLFAGAAEAAGTDRVMLTIENQETLTIAKIKATLMKQSLPLAAILDRAWFAINDQYADLEATVRDGDQVAVIPPVSGGQNETSAWQKTALQHEPLSIDVMYQAMLRKEAGAVIIFSGIVREITGDLQTLYLEYEAYESMALVKLAELVKDCEAKFPGVVVAIWHRLGHLDPAESSVLIGVSSPHRDAAFHAGHYAIDELKQRVPIWKKEFFQNGDAKWATNEHWNPSQH